MDMYYGGGGGDAGQLSEEELEEAFMRNASIPYEMLETESPGIPMHFDEAMVGRAERVDARVLNPFSGEVREVSNIVYEERHDGQPPERAYWVGRKLMEAIYGCIRVCTILELRNDAQVPFSVTERKAAVKVLTWEKIRTMNHAENPEGEIAALQHVARAGGHQNVMSALDVLQDEEYLLIFMPFFSSGSLYDFVSRAGCFPERVARYWFTQLLDGITHLQKLGICHRDLSLENICVDEYTSSAIIDLGMCLRVPFIDQVNGGDTDVSCGGTRRLMTKSGTCGKIWYMAPEILRNDDVFDGFAIDLWGAAIILFIMLTGRPPWPFASHQAAEFRVVAIDAVPDYPNISSGIGRLLHEMGKEVSAEAADLLQRMLRENPRERLSLFDVLQHPWLQDAAEAEHQEDPLDEWRQS